MQGNWLINADGPNTSVNFPKLHQIAEANGEMCSFWNEEIWFWFITLLFKPISSQDANHIDNNIHTFG